MLFKSFTTAHFRPTRHYCRAVHYWNRSTGYIAFSHEYLTCLPPLNNFSLLLTVDLRVYLSSTTFSTTDVISFATRHRHLLPATKHDDELLLDWCKHRPVGKTLYRKRWAHIDLRWYMTYKIMALHSKKVLETFMPRWARRQHAATYPEYLYLRAISLSMIHGQCNSRATSGASSRKWMIISLWWWHMLYHDDDSCGVKGWPLMAYMLIHRVILPLSAVLIASRIFSLIISPRLAGLLWLSRFTTHGISAISILY